MSPQDVPSSYSDYQHHGSLFTLFLHSPLTAVCYICNVGDVPIHHWERCQTIIDKFTTEASKLVTRCRVDDTGKGRDCLGQFKLLHCLKKQGLLIIFFSLPTVRFSIFTIFR